jgi:cytoskeletal protein CcmA (bactofilin family)
MAIIVVFALLVLMFIIPFLPGIIEYYRKTDADPLFVAIGYSKDPRYFGTSFRHILANSVEGLKQDEMTVNVKLSKRETIEITADRIIPSENEIDHLLYIKGDLASGNHVKLITDVFATGNVSLGADNIVHVLAADGNIILAKGVLFKRWVDAEGKLDVSENCDLGISATSGSILRIAGNCLFRRLYAMPIISGTMLEPTADDYDKIVFKGEKITDIQFVREKKSVIPHSTEINSNIVFVKAVEIGHDSIFRGAVKSYGNLDILENVTIFGNVFADGDIRLGKGTIVLGNIFSQGSVFLSSGVRIGRPNIIKSIIGKKNVTIEKDVIIYGYVATEGIGLTI